MSDQTPRVPDQPDGIDDYSFDLPDKERAAARVNEFLSWFGDGEIGHGAWIDNPPLYARDLQALTNATLAPPADAVKLGDVEALREKLAVSEKVRKVHAAHITQLTAERDALRAEIRAVLDHEWTDESYDEFLEGKLELIEGILDREPGREEPRPRKGAEPPFRSETSWAAWQIVKAARDTAMSAETADGWVCAARDAAAVLRTVGMVLGPYHEQLAAQCEALADECGQVVEHQPEEGDRG